jgi:hypothetical protein
LRALSCACSVVNMAAVLRARYADEGCPELWGFRVAEPRNRLRHWLRGTAWRPRRENHSGEGDRARGRSGGQGNG